MRHFWAQQVRIDFCGPQGYENTMKVALTLMLLMLAGCRTAPAPSGRSLVSVSFVNRSPEPLAFLRVTVDEGPQAARLETLAGYDEVWVPYAMPLSTRPRARVSWAQEGEGRQGPVLQVPPPTRRAADGQYHLRIFLGGAVTAAELGPEALSQRRQSARDAARGMTEPEADQ